MAISQIKFSRSLSLLVFAAACSSKPIERSTEVSPPLAAHTIPAAVTETPATEHKTEHAVEHKAAPQDAHDNHHATAAATKDSHAANHHPAPKTPDAQTAWTYLKNGNNRYLKKHYRKDGKTSEDRKRLAKGQAPHTIVLSCSDSRVPPEHIFDQALGELFVIRVAGEALDSSVVASIEYAVAHLGTQLLVVMGHESCGAVKAAATAQAGVSTGSADLDKLVADIKPRLTRFPSSSSTKNYIEESKVNASSVAQDLLNRSAIIRDKVKAGQLTIKPALYYLETGAVEWM